MVLKKFYDNRFNHDFEKPKDGDINGVDIQHIYAICEQLSELGFIKWKSVLSHDITHDGIGSITAKGVNEIENNESSNQRQIIGELKNDRKNMIKIFISHSHNKNDAALVGKLIDLFRSALNLSAQEIRCTSVDGYKLPAGASINEQIRHEVDESESFICVISESSLKSMYCIFELGARWGTKKYFIPLLENGVDVNSIGEPLKSLQYVQCDNSSEMHQLVHELSEHLNIKYESPAVYQKKIDEIVNIKLFI